MRPLAITILIGGPLLGGVLLLGPGFAGARVSPPLAASAGLFAGAGVVIGAWLWIQDRRTRCLAKDGLRSCGDCGQPMPLRASRCPECGRMHGGVDPLDLAVRRSTIGADIDAPCPDCGRRVRLDQVDESREEVAGQHRCLRCGSLRHT